MADPVLERLPAFRSHKIVRAAKITAAHAYLHDRRVGVEIETGYGTVTTELEGKTAERFRLAFPNATDAVGSYLVVYPPSGDETEPYISWSPAAAFEGGYTPLEHDTKVVDLLAAALALRYGEADRRAAEYLACIVTL